MKKITVLGGDERNYHLCRFLVEEGYEVSWLFAEKSGFRDSFIDKGKTDISSGYALVLPLPLSRDGASLNTPLSDKKIYLRDLNFLSDFSFVFTSGKVIQGINYFEDESVTIKNARLTAVGFLKELLIYEKDDIMGKKALVTGYGRVSKAVCDILRANGVWVTVAARSRVQRSEAMSKGMNAVTIAAAQKKIDEFDYVINTVPQKLFENEFIIKANESTAFFELAQGMIDKSVFTPSAYIECKGMPGRHTPKAAGRVIASFVCDRLRE